MKSFGSAPAPSVPGVRTIWIFIGVLLLLRLITLGSSPLYDLTEGRYAEIGREMAATGDWVTPRLGPDKPFFSKPPLHYWMEALNMRLLGYNELAARLPGFISALVTLGLVALLAAKLYGRKAAAWSALVLATSAVFFFSVAIVMTDMTLCASVTGVMVCLILTLESPGAGEARRWGYATFAFAGLGMLAKGPVAIALCVLAVLFWLVATRRPRALGRLPWAGGILLALLICIPWYVLAEIRNPGFLKYFIVNEHILRFLRPDFGDPYGNTGHTFVRGMIWAMMFAGFLPWSPLLLFAAWRAWRRKLWRQLGAHGAEALLIGWLLAPLVLFTLARSVMITYVLPSIPACAILAGRLLASYEERSRESSRMVSLRPLDPLYLLAIPSLLCLPAVVAGLIYIDRAYDLPLWEVMLGLGLAVAFASALLVRVFRFRRFHETLCLAALIPCFALYGSVVIDDELGHRKSAHDVAMIIRQNQRLQGRPVAFYGTAPYSAEFYLGDRVSSLNKDKGQMKQALSNRDVLVIREKDLKKIPADEATHLEKIDTCTPYVVMIQQ